jgi:hypothetical protein
MRIIIASNIKRLREMRYVTLDQLRLAAETGAILSVTLRAQGVGFYLHAEPRSGDEMVLMTTRGREPRAFGDVRKALMVLRELGIREARIDTRQWNPESGELLRAARPDRTKALKDLYADATAQAGASKTTTRKEKKDA